MAIVLSVVAPLLLLLTASGASAHAWPGLGTSTVRQDGLLVHYALEVAYGRLASAADLEQLRPAAEDAELISSLVSERGRLGGFVTDRVVVELDGSRCPGELDDLGVAWRQGYPYAQLELTYRCTGSAEGEFAVHYGMFAKANGFGPDHTSVVDYDFGGAGGRDVFESGHQELRVSGKAASEKAGLMSSTVRFVTLGWQHILHGIDHLLFIVLLLLGAQGWRSVMKLATSFTAAHSVTLALAALGWVEVPAKVVEPLIALSIVYVAVENILRRDASRHRLLVVFGFGLLHGLGFASALSFADDIGFRLLMSLISFNAGIELGQLMIVVLVFPLILLARRAPWSSLAHAGAAASAGAVGLVWFMERLVQAPGAG